MKFYVNAFQSGNNIFYSGYNFLGEKVFLSDNYKPSLFIKNNTKNNTKYHLLDGTPVDKITFDSIKESKDFIKKYENVDNFSIYGMRNYIYTWISDHFKDEISFDVNLIKVLNFDIEVKYSSNDVNTSCKEANDKITAITATWGDGIYHVYVYNDGYKPNTSILNDKNSKIEYHKCLDEVDLINSFIELWTNNGHYPDIVSGWNVKKYDVPYIINRMNTLGLDTSILSPFGLIYENEDSWYGKKIQIYDIKGINILDFLECYQQFTYKKLESYKLDHVAYVELGEKKLDYSEYSSLNSLYENNFQRYVDYNIKDVELVQRIMKKTGILDVIFGLSYSAKINYEDTFYQVRMWDVLSFNALRENNIVIPNKEKNIKKFKYAGAYVKKPKLGFTDWIVSFDLNSLYPNIMIQFQISPETRITQESIQQYINQGYEKEVNYLVKNMDSRGIITQVNPDNLLQKKVDPKIFECIKKLDLVLAGNGALYRKDKQGFIPKLLEKFYTKRKKYKDKSIEYKKQYEKEKNEELKEKAKLFDVLQLAMKIFLNSCYGAIGSEYYRYYEIINAEAVTLSGQYIIRESTNQLNSFLNKVIKTKNVDYCIANDTDSSYLNLNPLVDHVFNGKERNREKIINFLDKFSSEYLEKELQTLYDEIYKKYNSYKNRMVMKREVIAEKGIWTAKKRYILKVWDNEGIRYKNKPKYKVMGIEAVKSSTPEPIRKSLSKAFEILLSNTEDDMINYINTVKEKFNKLSYYDIAFPRGTHNIFKYYDKTTIYKKGCPIHVRGALIYNHYLKKMQLTNKYELINNGDRVKYIYLKTPNKFKENIISFSDILPKEFGITKFVDYDKQFEKAFLGPLKIILDIVNWNIEKRNTLESFF